MSLQKMLKNFLEKVQESIVTGLGRRTREEIAKWNQMTALRFQTGGGDIRHPRPPFRGQLKAVIEQTAKVQLKAAIGQI